MIIFLQIAGGLSLLLIGGETLVRGSVAIARHFGIPILIVGLTIIAIGTSAPELVVSIQAALKNHPDIAIGNIIGSNTTNILLALGITAMIFPIAINNRIVHRDAPIMLSATILFVVFCFTSSGTILAVEGLILLGCLVGYTWYTVRHAYSERGADKNEHETKEELPPDLSNIKAVFFILLGISLLAYGADVLVEGAVSLAKLFGLSEGVIALTIVAVGSSAPEIITCVVAATRKHSDIVAGNIIGSNLLNILAGIGIPAIMSDGLQVSEQFKQIDLWFMLAVTIIVTVIIKLRKKVGRLAGILFFMIYIGYIIVQFMLK